MNCKLDNVSFRGTEFIHTAFVNCSMQSADFADTIAAGALFSDCDLTGAIFSPAKPYTRWASTNLDDKIMPSFFNDCALDNNTTKFLKMNGCITNVDEDLTANQCLELAAGINNMLQSVVIAPVADL